MDLPIPNNLKDYILFVPNVDIDVDMFYFAEF